MISLKQPGTLLLLVLLSLPSQIFAAPAPFDLDLKELDRQEPASHKSEKKVQKTKSAPAARTGKERPTSADNSEPTRYTVQPGDHIFKILMVHFGMSNEAAERLIPEIARLNDISNIRHLTIGQTLLIPGKRQREQEHVARHIEKGKTRNKSAASQTASLPENSSKLAKGAAGLQEVAAPVAPTAPSTTQVEKTAIAHAPVAPAQPVPAAARPLQPAPTPAQPVAAVAPRIPAAPAIPTPLANTWICSVTERDASKIVDDVLNALSLHWSRNWIIQSTAPTAFSIRVDRYFEYKQARYIVSIGERDPYNYTLVRLLEGAGYRVLRISGKEDFETVNKKIFALVGVVPVFGKHLLQGGTTATGFLIQLDDAGGRQVIISSEPADPHQKWVMPQGCGAK